MPGESAWKCRFLETGVMPDEDATSSQNYVPVSGPATGPVTGSATESLPGSAIGSVSYEELQDMINNSGPATARRLQEQWLEKMKWIHVRTSKSLLSQLAGA